jgi:hypothetical protein
MLGHMDLYEVMVSAPLDVLIIFASRAIVEENNLRYLGENKERNVRC